MAAEVNIGLFSPVALGERIDSLDVLRGLAILGIFFMNAPLMAVSAAGIFGNPRDIGWTVADQASWWGVQVLLDGTQRGLLQLLFGAGLMIFAARAMAPDGPVAVADLYWRRNLWLLAFGLVDIFVLGWAGDILHVYALAALFLFPFRRLGARVLLALGLCFAAYSAITGAARYVERAELVSTATSAEQKQAGQRSSAESDALNEWREKRETWVTGGPMLGKMRQMEQRREDGLVGYLALNISIYTGFIFGFLVETVAEAFCVMLIGMALWKWGIMQGRRSPRFYLLLMLACYLPGYAVRFVQAAQMLGSEPGPMLRWITAEPARIAVSVGHVAAVHWAIGTAVGRWLLLPFRAAGRTAFSLYFMQQIIGLWVLFSPWGLLPWDEYGWGEIAAVTLVVVTAQLLVANLWLRAFVAGPLEWLWRSLSYWRVQPFRRRAGEPVAPRIEPARA